VAHPDVHNRLEGAVRALLVLAALLMATPALGQGAFGDIKEAEPSRTLSGHRRAIVIGINQYGGTGFEDLRYARADATELAAVLAEPTYGGFTSVELVVDGDLSALGIVKRLEAWGKTLAPDDLAFVYFSGHGTRWLDERNRSRVFLATQGSRKNDPLQNSLPMESMREFVETLPTMRRVLLVDACFTGQGKVSDTDADAAAKAVVDEVLPFPDRAQDGEAYVFATTYGKPALESESLGHGVYSYHFIQALSERFDDADLDGDLTVSVSEAHDYARDETMRGTDSKQVPMIQYRFIGRETLLLSGDANARRRSRLAMVTSYQGPQAGINLYIDGQEKGAFPRSVLIEPGTHTVEFRNEAGKVIDRGRVRFAPEQVIEVTKIRDTLNGGRHVLQLGYAHTWLPGEAWRTETVPSAPGFRVGYELRFPSKNPFVRRLGLEFDLSMGFFPEVETEYFNAPVTAPFTVGMELGFGPTLRIDMGPMYMSAMPRIAVMNLWRETLDKDPYGHWLFGAAGAQFSFGGRPTHRLGISVHYAPMLFNADLDSDGQADLEVMHRLVGGVEIGF
jgi:uncharacterized caspase-like protein